MEEFPASKVHLQPATWVTGTFPSRRMSRHYWPVWVWPKGKIYTFSGGGGGVGGGKTIRYSVYIALIFIKETWDHFTWHTAWPRSLITNTTLTISRFCPSQGFNLYFQSKYQCFALMPSLFSSCLLFKKFKFRNTVFLLGVLLIFRFSHPSASSRFTYF